MSNYFFTILNFPIIVQESFFSILKDIISKIIQVYIKNHANKYAKIFGNIIIIIQNMIKLIAYAFIFLSNY